MQVAVNHQLISDLKVLSSIEMEGRAPGTIVSQRAQHYIVGRFKALGLLPFDGAYRHPFNHQRLRNKQGDNIIAMVTGTQYPKQFIAISAHYDHLGKKGRHVFYGSDDNSSGVAILLDLARYIHDHPPAYSVVFIATDAEEKGLLGAKEFVKKYGEKIRININLDMLGRSKKTYYLASSSMREKLATQLSLSEVNGMTYKRRHRLKHSQQTIDYKRASDHYAFARQSIDYVFLTGGSHADYHKVTDTSDKISPEKFSRTAYRVKRVYLAILLSLA